MMKKMLLFTVIGLLISGCSSGGGDTANPGPSITCDPGQYLIGSACEPVGIGYYSAENNSRVACPTHSSTSLATSSSESDCLADLGFYKNPQGSFVEVGLGYMSSALNNSRTACPAGTYSDSTTAGSCTTCTNTPDNSTSFTYNSTDLALPSNSCGYASVTCKDGYIEDGSSCHQEVFIPTWTDPNYTPSICEGTFNTVKDLTGCTRSYSTFSEPVNISFCSSATPPIVTITSPAGDLTRPIKNGSETVHCAAGSYEETLVSRTCSADTFDIDGGCYRKFAKIDAFKSGQTLVLTDLNGVVRASGSNNSGLLGTGTTGGMYLSPVILPSYANAKSISLSGSHLCAVMSDNSVKCSGSNSSNQLGNGTFADSDTPITISQFGTVDQILSIGQSNTCTLLTNNTVKCTGYADSGEFGAGGSISYSTPTTIAAWNTAKKFSIGNTHACAIMLDNSVKCAGKNDFGQLGDGTNNARNTPVTIPGFFGAVDILALGMQTCAIMANQKVKCTGSNQYNGQFGNGTLDDSNTPVEIPEWGDVKAIAGSGGHICVITTSDEVKCAGENVKGQTGKGSTSSREVTPVTVAGFAGAKKLTLSAESTCAIMADDTVKCVGGNSSGQFGNGGQYMVLIPTRLTW